MIRNLLLILFATGTAIFSWLYFKNDKAVKLAYVDTIYLYEHANVRTHYKNLLDEKKQQSKLRLDSLYKQAQQLNTEAAGYAFGKQKEEMEYELAKLEKEYDEKIRNQITEATLAYGDKEGYDFIMGANGQGSLMYAAKGHNISEDVLKHLNQTFNDED